MSDKDAPELSVAEMMARIRQHLAARRDPDVYANAASHPFGTPPHLKGGLNGHPTTTPNPVDGPTPQERRFRGYKPSVDWYQMMDGLRIAEKYCLIGKYVPELKRWPSPVRLTVRTFARALLLMTKFITNRQRAFNHCTLGALGNIHGVLHHFEKVQRENLQRIEDHLAQQDAEIRQLRARLADLEARFAQPSRDVA
jgi:hypothetical protein